MIVRPVGICFPGSVPFVLVEADRETKNRICQRLNFSLQSSIQYLKLLSVLHCICKSVRYLPLLTIHRLILNLECTSLFAALPNHVPPNLHVFPRDTIVYVFSRLWLSIIPRAREQSHPREGTQDSTKRIDVIFFLFSSSQPSDRRVR